MDHALGWYIGEVVRAKAPPVSREEAEALRDLLAGRRGRGPGDFEILVNFGRTIFRINQLGDAPACNLGDALTALAAIEQPGETPFQYDPAVDSGAFAKLDFRDTSLGIAKAQRDNREGWWSHGQKNRAFIEEAAARTTEKNLAVVLGAGAAFDLPLVELARRFDKLVLVDIDAQAMEQTIAGVFKDPGLRAKVEARAVDLTGINRALVERLESVLSGPGTAAEVFDRIERLCQLYRLAEPPRLLPAGERADLLVSSCVLTQLAWPQRIFAERLYEKRFTPVRGPLEQRWARAFSELELRVQQDHLTALSGVAEVVAFTSDVVSQVTALDASGTERTSGHTIYALGVPSLLERIPKLFQTDAHRTWEWPRYRATPKGQGSRMTVEGVVLTPAQRPSGLWVP
ncbi:MAG TPA: hypothetical protein VN914_20560 [Polyangia bacterium]|nr:hypothetical protein [Polyangia bacterium]